MILLSHRAHLGVECCPVCHIDYPGYELAVVKFEASRKAWLWRSLDYALNPSKRVAVERSPS
ncbi:hypothetical protein [Edaphobacter bradus]|uniref:hypothetical protein n=1 Tax=Edaphobacter bradus TaxID=2259016 RepID=UPI0021DFACC1|nr:hypothetical protein [Edaphobacter bradus]